MRLISTGLAMACLLTTAMAAEPAVDARMQATIDKLQAEALASDLPYAIVSSLTTEVGPRISGSEAEARARAWAVAKAKALGFKTVWTQDATVPGWRRISETAEIVSPAPQKLVVTALGGSVAGDVTGEIVMFKDLAALKASTERLDGKIVFVAKRMERKKDGAGYGPAVGARSGTPIEAARLGAAGALIRSVGTDDHRLPHTGSADYAKPLPNVPIAALSNPDADQLVRLLENGQKVTVRLDLKTEAPGPLPTGNVIAEVKGSERPDEILVIGGHLDSWDLGTGAIDDGTGIAITMAAARMIDQLPKHPKRTIRFVAFGDEERHGAGSDAYFKSQEGKLDRHVFVGESDFGTGRVYEIATSYQDANPALHAALVKAVAPLGLAESRAGRAEGADIENLAEAGVPGVSLSQDGTTYFDLHHTADDTLDKVDPAALRQNVAAWATALYIVADWPGEIRKAK